MAAQKAEQDRVAAEAAARKNAEEEKRRKAEEEKKRKAEKVVRWGKGKGKRKKR